MRPTLRATLVFALTIAACGGGPSTTTRSASPVASAPAATRSPVVVAIVVDQLAAWIAEERFARLPKDGGFARLLREGTWVKSMRYPYAITDTAPGHASLHTGRVPAESGIFTNDRPDEKTGKRSSVFVDGATRMIGPAGPIDRPASSAKRLAVPTVADRLREARPDAVVLSVSLKDRASLLPAGQRPTHALWYDQREGSFVTSSALTDAFPKWGAALADRAAVTKAMASTWLPGDAAWLARVAGKDERAGEGDFDGLGIVFPHVIKTPTAFRATPRSDAMILDLALAGARAERRPDAPLLLLVSLSANDIIGHTFGPDSWEAWDHLAKLDAMLASFFVDLEAAVGPFSVLLAGDHGGSSMPEARLPLPAGCRDGSLAPDPYERPRCIAGGRLEPDALRLELRAESAKAVGSAEHVAGIADGCVFLTKTGLALEPEKRAALDAAIRRVLLEKHEAEVAEVYDVRDLARRCPDVRARARGIPERAKPGEDLLTLVCRSWPSSSDAGDFIIVPKPGFFFDGELVPGKGSSHGTPYLHDRTVPLLVRSAERGADDGRVVEGAVDFTAYSAVAATLLGLEPGTVRGAIEARLAR